MQGRQGVAPYHLRLGGARLLQRAFKIGCRDRVHGGVERLDAGDTGLHQLQRRQLAPADEPPQFDGAKFDDVRLHSTGSLALWT